MRTSVRTSFYVRTGCAPIRASFMRQALPVEQNVSYDVHPLNVPSHIAITAFDVTGLSLDTASDTGMLARALYILINYSAYSNNTLRHSRFIFNLIKYKVCFIVSTEAKPVRLTKAESAGCNLSRATDPEVVTNLKIMEK